MSENEPILRPEHQRLFFALQAKPIEAQQVQRQLSPLFEVAPRARWVPVENYHLTLAFLGSLDGAAAQAMRAVARRLSLPRLSLRLNQVGHFPQPRVLWIGPDQPPAALLRFVSHLHQALAPLGYRSEYAQFRPHVTVARSVPRWQGPEQLPGVDWNEPHWGLFESCSRPPEEGGGVRYRCIESWPARDGEAV